TSRNLIVTMLLGGLWHGASWTFVAWGLYHGLLLLATRHAERILPIWPTALRRVATFVLVVIGWVLFRSDNFSMASGLFAAMFSLKPGVPLEAGMSLTVLLLIAGSLAHFGPNTFELRHQWRPVPALALGALMLASMVAIYGGPQSPFLYFQF